MASGVQIDNTTGSNRLSLISVNLMINIPHYTTGDTIAVVTETTKTGSPRGIRPTNATRIAGNSLSSELKHVNVFIANADGTVTFTTIGGALYFYSISVKLAQL